MNTQEIVKHFEGILGSKEIIVTGSTSLDKQGFEVEAKDLDLIILTPTEAIRETLLRMSMDGKANPQGYLNPMYRIMFGTNKVDLFPVKNFDREPYFESEGLKWSYATQVIKAKKFIGRAKDWVDLYRISTQICTQAEFLKHMNARVGLFPQKPSPVGDTEKKPSKR